MIYDDDRDHPLTERIRPRDARWPRPQPAPAGAPAEPVADGNIGDGPA